MRIFAIVALLTAIALPGYAQGVGDKKTERTWKAKCASCHGNDGKGTTAQGTKMGVGDMTTKEWQGKFSDGQMIEAITNGINRENGGKQQKMDAYKDKLTADQIKALVTYIRAFAKK